MTRYDPGVFAGDMEKHPEGDWVKYDDTEIMGAYIVGDYMGGESLGVIWEMVGVFTSEEKAVAACTKKSHFVAPLEMNAIAPDETVEWPDCYYPLSDVINK